MSLFPECDVSGSTFILKFIKCTIGLTDVGQGPLAGILLLFAGMFALFGVSKQVYGTERALLASSFIGVIASMVLTKLGFLPSKIIYLCVVLFIVAIILYKNSEGEGP